MLQFWKSLLNQTGRFATLVPSGREITKEELKKCHFRQFKKSSDILAQCVALSRVSSGDPRLWNRLSRTVTQSVALFTGEDLATLLKHFSKWQIRDELMLAAVCESLKSLPLLRLVRPSDIASILWSFQRLRFAPSVEVLNVLASEVRESLPKYKLRNIHLSLLFRYFAILNESRVTVLMYDAQFQHGQLVALLEDRVIENIGRMGPVELVLITQHAKRISKKTLVANFTRCENVKPHLVKSFLAQLDMRFGKDSWKELAFMFRHSFVDSTGWNKEVKQFDPDDSDLDEVSEEKAKRLAPLQLDDRLVQEVLRSAPRISSSNADGKDREKKQQKIELPEIDMDFIVSMEREMMQDIEPKGSKTDLFSERIDRKVLRELEVKEAKSLPQTQHASLRRFKNQRKKHLLKFALLSLAS